MSFELGERCRFSGNEDQEADATGRALAGAIDVVTESADNGAYLGGLHVGGGHDLLAAPVLVQSRTEGLRIVGFERSFGLERRCDEAVSSVDNFRQARVPASQHGLEQEARKERHARVDEHKALA